jgi:hypothetical protein
MEKALSLRHPTMVETSLDNDDDNSISYLIPHSRMVFTTIQHDFSKQFFIVFISTPPFHQDV